MLDRIENILKSIIGIIMILVTGVVFIQVILRYVFNSPLTWSEELARYLIIWMVFLGMPVAIRKGLHLAMSVNIFDRLPKSAILALNTFLNLLILIALYFIVRYGFTFAILCRSSKAMILPISLSLVYFAVPIGSLITIVFLIEKMWIQITGFMDSGF